MPEIVELRRRMQAIRRERDHLRAAVRMLDRSLAEVGRALSEQTKAVRVGRRRGVHPVENIAEMWIAGHSQREIADSVGLSPSAIHTILASRFRQERVPSRDRLGYFLKLTRIRA
jgi:DNA-binding CsgD family transcriptional regulator